MSLTLAWYINWVKTWDISPKETIDWYLQKADWNSFNAFARIHNEYASTNIEAFSSLWLCWAPISIKDNFLVQWTISSCWSKMLEDFVSPYTSTVIQNLEKAWGLMIWKTNMDEFAMWSSTETCYFGNVLNPLDLSRVPWGSSWWSAASVAWDLCLASIWTDTAWSVRQPAAMCGVVWVKPTYWRTSRYWIQAMSSSLDQAWVITKTVEDAVLLLESISWQDNFDAMTIYRSNDTTDWNISLQSDDLSWIKLALPREFLSEWLDDRIRDRLDHTIEIAKKLWATVDIVEVPLLSYWVPTYYILCPAEVSSNLSRFDGIRFWLWNQTDTFESIDDYYSTIRQQWFWPEVLRRIMVWSYVLSAWFYDAYYKKAQQVRSMMTRQIDWIFDSYDAIIWPTSPILPWKLWELSSDPVQMYLADIYTVIANLAWIPAATIPMWNVKEAGYSLPTWFQIMTKHRDEATMFRIASVLESSLS